VSFIEISKQNYFHNLDILCYKLKSKDRLAVVLKDNAYGHGLIPMAKLSAEYGITKVIVRTSDEARQVKSYFKSIIILSPNLQEENHIKFSFVINDLSQIEQLPKNAKVHLKVDTGMHRSGILDYELDLAYKLIEKNDLILEAVMTHFRSADELSSELFWQQKNWNEVKQKVLTLTQKYNFKKPLFHSANSAALLRVTNYEDDFARCGIATFGYHQMPSCYETSKLKPVLSLWAEKIATRDLKEGQRVGYGGSYTAQTDMKVSTYDIGYGDGFFRHCNQGIFLGKVSMDSCSIKGDAQKICILSDASEIANHFDTISYDVLVKLSPTINRVIVR
jgi:alanine racemase